MKKIILTAISIVLLSISFTQETSENNKLKSLPDMEVETMQGEMINAKEFTQNGPAIISFWATWCSPCKRELNTINDMYTDWQDEFGVTLYAVSIDDQKTKKSVPIYVNGKAWDYEVIMDPNSDFRRAMGVNNVPHTFLVNKNGEIVYSHNNYSPGDEEILYQELQKLNQE